MYRKIREKNSVGKRRRVSREGVVVLMIIVFLAGFFVFWIARHAQMRVSRSAFNPSLSPSVTPDPLRPRNILLLGYAGGSHEGGTLTDTIINFHIVPKTRKIYLISIPRDLYVSLPLYENDSFEAKINEAYPIGNNDKKYKNKIANFSGKDGGGNLAKSAVGGVLGMDIEKYVTVNFSGFRKAFDLVGPLDVEVPYSFSDEFYPLDGLENDACGKTEDEVKEISSTMSGFLLERQFPCRFETVSFKKGTVRMSSEDALKFVRSRHSSDNTGDFGRAKRQQALIKAVKSKVLSPSFILKTPELFDSLSKNISTDLSTGDIISYLRIFSGLGEYDLTSIVLSDENVLEATVNDSGQYVLLPKDGFGSYGRLQSFLEDELSQSSDEVLE